MAEKVAYLGLGRMGIGMVLNLRKHGYPVAAWNRSPDRPSVAEATAAGVEIAPTITAAVAGVEMICMCVSDIPDVEDVLFGAGGVAASAASGTIVVDLSTIGVDAALDFARRLNTCKGDGQEGLTYVDAPCTGGDIGARAGTLTTMVGTDDATLARILPVMKCFGENVVHCGPTGRGQGVKMINQLLGAVHGVVITEALGLAKSLDLDPQLIIDVCGKGAAGSWALNNILPLALAGKLEPGFRADHMLKDLNFIRAYMEKNGLSPDDFPLYGESRERFERLVAQINESNSDMLGTHAVIVK